MVYIKRLITVVIITWLAALVTGSVFDHFYKKRWSVIFFKKTDELIRSNHYYDIIFLGNSRVHFGINPFYVDSVTKLTSYNFGNGGADAQDIMLTSNIYLQQHKAPKLAIISVDMGALIKNVSLQTRFHYLFYLDNDTINKYMKEAGFLTALMKIFPFTRYSFFDEYNRTSIFVKGKPYPVFDHNICKGFINIDQHVNSKMAGVYNIQADSDKLWEPAIAYLRITISGLKNKGCKVILVSPPEKITSSNRGTSFKNQTDSIFKAIANEYHLKYLHFENDPTYKNEYFVDDIHLNEPGTRIYSLQIADSINRFYAK